MEAPKIPANPMHKTISSVYENTFKNTTIGKQ